MHMRQEPTMTLLCGRHNKQNDKVQSFERQNKHTLAFNSKFLPDPSKDRMISFAVLDPTGDNKAVVRVDRTRHYIVANHAREKELQQ